MQSGLTKRRTCHLKTRNILRAGIQKGESKKAKVKSKGGGLITGEDTAEGAE
jgi:hypothetical protein